jgi:predicted phage terminase large subunit-like protein
MKILKLDYEIKQYHRVMADKLEKVEKGEIRRLMLWLPPRHGKSTMSSIFFPAWYMGRNPTRQVILSAYNTALATRFGKQVRDIVASPQYGAIFPESRVRKDSQAADCWYTEAGGVVLSSGIGGGITGWGADLLGIDDPLRDPSEAYSQTIKDGIWDWYGQAAYTRLMPGGAVIGTMTRWAEDDLGGRIMEQAKKSGEEWEVVRFPALAEEKDLLGREVGEALWPERYPVERLQEIKMILGDQFSSLYQQSPFVAGGNIFKKEWWQFYSGLMKCDEVVQSWDTAFKEEERNDFSVCTTWGYKHPNIYLLDRFKKKMEFPELKRMADVLAQRWRPRGLLVEDSASGQSLIQELRRESVWPVIPVKHDGRSKESRAHAVTPLVQGGRVYLPEGTGWVEEYIMEMAKFPKGAHDDDVDSTVMALSYIKPWTDTLYDLQDEEEWWYGVKAKAREVKSRWGGY